MKNKFLDKYPQLREPEIGDKIEVLQDHTLLFYPPRRLVIKGEYGIIKEIIPRPPYAFNRATYLCTFSEGREFWLLKKDIKII